MYKSIRRFLVDVDGRTAMEYAVIAMMILLESSQHVNLTQLICNDLAVPS